MKSDALNPYPQMPPPPPLLKNESSSAFEKYKEFFNHSPLGLLEIDPRGLILLANAQACGLLETPPERLVGLPFWDFVEKGAENSLKALASKEAFRLLSPSMKEKWVTLSIKPLGAEEDGLFSVLVFLTDVTRAKKAETAQKLVTDSLSIGLWEYDSSTSETTWGEGNYRLYDLDPQDARAPGIVWRNLLPKKDLDRIDKIFRECINNPGSAFSTTCEVVISDSRRRYVAIRGFSHLKSSGAGVIIRGVSFDITELEEARKRLDLALETLNLGIWEFLPRQNKIFWSAMQYRIFGVRNSEFDASIEGFFSLVVPEDHERLKRELAATLQKGSPFSSRFRIRHPSKGLRHIRSRAYAERDKTGEVIRLVGLNWDVTEEILREEKLQHRGLLNLNQARLATMGEMAAGIAHEINNPLAIILGNAERLLADLPGDYEDKPRLEAYAQKILETSERIQKIIKGLRSLSRDASRDPFEVHSLGQIVQDSLAFVEERLKYFQIDLRLDAVDANLKILCRPVEISQVFINLVNNSIDALKEIPHSWISIETKVKNGEIQILFTDSGLGIPPQIASQIMNPFFTTKSSHEGTGLGLSISENIVKAHHGSIKLDKGYKLTRFIITLPMIDSI
jgi:PAS domain S-box-containing protein